MSKKSGWEDLTIGLEMGPLEIVLDNNTIKERVHLVQWENRESLDKFGVTPPGITIANHAKMCFMTWPDLHVSIWAKSEHEFIKPLKVGSKLCIRGRVIDKYVKRGLNYVVSDCQYIP